MDASTTQRAVASRRLPGPSAWGLLGLLLTAALGTACSDNKGPSGPTFPAGQTGTADTTAQIRVQVAVNPGTIVFGRRAGVTVLVTNLNGRQLAGRHVQLSTTAGNLDRVDGFTDADGKFTSALRITEADATGQTSATVTAFVEGATGTAIVNFPAVAGLFLSPPSVTQNATTAGTSCVVGGFTSQFTVSGGAPPYQFSSQGSLPGESISQSGLLTIGTFTLGVGATATTVVTVTDSLGRSISATVTLSCTSQTP